MVWTLYPREGRAKSVDILRYGAVRQGGGGNVGLLFWFTGLPTSSSSGFGNEGQIRQFIVQRYGIYGYDIVCVGPTRTYIHKGPVSYVEL